MKCPFGCVSHLVIPIGASYSKRNGTSFWEAS